MMLVKPLPVTVTVEVKPSRLGEEIENGGMVPVCVLLVLVDCAELVVGLAPELVGELPGLGDEEDEGVDRLAEGVPVGEYSVWVTTLVVVPEVMVSTSVTRVRMNAVRVFVCRDVSPELPSSRGAAYACGSGVQRGGLRRQVQAAAATRDDRRVVTRGSIGYDALEQFQWVRVWQTKRKRRRRGSRCLHYTLMDQ